MAEAFFVPVIPTLNVASTIPQGNCNPVTAVGSSGTVKYYIASNVSNCVAATYNASSATESKFHIVIASPSSGKFRVVGTDAAGTVTSQGSEIQFSNNSVSGIGGYAYNYSNSLSPAGSLTFHYGNAGNLGASVNLINALRTKAAIKYRLTNCSAPNAPQFAASGQTVAVQLVIASGFQIMSPDDVYVENNGEKIPSSFVNNTITFVMP